MKKQTEETQIKHQVKDYLKLKGWFIFHNLAGLGVYSGISDFFAIKSGIWVAVEIKTLTGKQSDNQIMFQCEVESHGGHYKILRSLEDAIAMDKWLDQVIY